MFSIIVFSCLYSCSHPGCAFGPYPNRDIVVQHYRKEHIPDIMVEFVQPSREEIRPNEQCAICKERQDTRVRFLVKNPHCGHITHLKCMRRWSKTRFWCPVPEC